ncbi:Putative DNA polymerase III subunit delta [Candidatus Phycorickettsia trachydisci]|uniref:DNA-directed DNA polymerase n=1 Tax=Candidatus Phycorickettsia trachydisci TaxID=2115978 RepID=A0A2P1P9Z8_9RICK|nr:hypothetical protein [Candidatus Phycorickettsia trachydisci]AVP88093.1 Putative DNA polymerase III subunit delta [Candidatus Phycorickettsia trachydisci]
MIFYPKNFDIVSHQIKSDKLYGIMFHGSEKGLIDYYVSQVQKILELPVRKITYSEDFALSETLNALSFFSTKEIIIITGVNGNITKEIAQTLKTQTHNFPIFIADDLAPSLKQLFQKQANLALVPCYPESAIDLQLIVKRYLAGKGIEPKALEYLCANLNSDRQFLYSELDKLLIYCNDKDQITLEDVHEAIVPMRNVSLDQLIISFVKGDLKNYLNDIECLLHNNIPEMLIIRSLVKYYTNLYTVKLHTKAGMSVDEAMKLLKPPVFFMYVKHFKEFVATLNCTSIFNALKLLTAAEVKLKSTGANVKNIFENLLLNNYEKNLLITYSANM